MASTDFRFLLNSRHVLAGLLEAFDVPAELGPGVLITLDKLDKLAPPEVTAELAGRGLAPGLAGELVAAMTAPDAAERIRAALKPSDEGAAGLDEVDEVLRADRHQPCRPGGSSSPRAWSAG